MSGISTDEQDGWAYVATGSEVAAQWVRQRSRMRALLREADRRNAAHRAVADYLRVLR